jgi:hypothetical protein
MTTLSYMRMGSATDVTSLCNGCVSLTSISPLLDWSKVTKAVFTFINCPITSFPPLDLSSLINANDCWRNCTLITYFPAIDFPALTSASQSWRGCTSMVTFGACTFPVLTNANNAWQGNVLMTTFLPTDFPAITSFGNTWAGDTSLVDIDINLPTGHNVSLSTALTGCVALAHDPFNDVQAVSSFNSTFSGDVLFKLNVGYWWPKTATNMTNMFSGVDLNDPASPVNLTTNSTVFGSWTLTAATVTSNPIAGPTGELTADLLKPSVTSTADHSASQNITVVSGSDYRAYCCFKLDGYSFGRLIVSGAFDAEVFVDLSDGSIISSVGTVSVTALNNGWYKLEVQGTAATTTLNIKCQAFATGVIAAYAGNATLGIYLWGGRAFLTVDGNVSNYDALLTGWTGWTAGAPDPLKTLQSNVTFSAGNSKYDLLGDAAAARYYLITVKGWIITDGGPY